MPKNTLQSIKKILKETTKSISLEDTVQSIVDEISEHLTSVGGAVFLVEKEKKLVRAYKITGTKAGNLILSTVRVDFRSLTTPYDKPVNNVGRCVASKKPIFGAKVEDLICPPVIKPLAKIIQFGGNIKELVAWPAIMQDEVVGALVLGFDKTGIQNDKDMLELMDLFMDQVAIAVNNALRYEELQKQYHEMIRRYEQEKALSAMISHELRTPLNIMAAYIENLRDFQNDKETVKEAIKDIEEAYERIYKIVATIITTTHIDRKTQLNKTKIQINKWTKNIFYQFQDKASSKNLNLNFKTKLNEDFKIRLDADKIEIVLKNLIENAIKYTKEGKIKLEINEKNNFLLFRVIDTGSGIPKEEQNKVFNRFYRIENKKNNNYKEINVGLGLGLYIAQGFIEAHNGKIEIEKSSNKGTCFLIQIPI
jgi:K+-sensing histidine kinase KdpD